MSVLLLRDPALEIGDRGAGAEHELLGLTHVEQRRRAAALRAPASAAAILPRRQRPLRDVELQVERAQLEVARSRPR